MSDNIMAAPDPRRAIQGDIVMKTKWLMWMGACLTGLGVAAAAHADKGPAGLHVVLREASRDFVLAPGQTGGVASACLAGETVVGGSPTGIPGNVAIAYSSLFFNGSISGWMVEYRNDGAQTVSVQATTAALCTAGRLTPG
ncbi:hypothetical protein [Hydrogenophaga sp. MI9]|uniref:hypothetical protein n=1 Tax=Hydrogenophaga sp. MI9 TaxID=3453719 RepID=UPI003EE931A3